MDSSSTQMSRNERYLTIRNIALISATANIILTLVTLFVGWIGHSQALIADGFHTLSDLVSDGVILIAARYSSDHADAEHPYGHGRFETVATIVVGTILLLVAFGILYSAGERLLKPELLYPPDSITLFVAAFSILVKEALYQYTMHIAKLQQSSMLRASAWHHRSDALSSVIVLIGILGSIFGITWLDAVAAIGVGLMISRIGWSLGWGGMRELVDTGLTGEELDTIKKVITSVDGVKTLHQLRTRRMGATVLVDVHIMVSPRISVSEGHQIGEMVRKTLIDKIEEIVDVIVHIDPENDEKYPANLSLPLRTELTKQLRDAWKTVEVSQFIDQITLHYLAGRLTVDIFLPLSVLETGEKAETLPIQLMGLIADKTAIRAVRVYYH